MGVEQPALKLNTIVTPLIESGRSSMSDTVFGSGSEAVTPVVSNFSQKDNASKSKKQKKANKQQGLNPEPKKQKPAPKVEKPFYQSLGEDLLKSTRLHLNPITLPLPKMPPMPVEIEEVQTPMSDRVDYFSQPKISIYDNLQRSKSTNSLALQKEPRESTESNFSGVTKIVRDSEDPSIKYRVKGAIYSLEDFNLTSVTEDLVLKYGRVAHMGVRDHSYKFWMNNSRTAVVHFKVLDKVAVLGGDPLCDPDRIDLTLKEFGIYCKKVGWKVAVVGGSPNMAKLAQQKGWTCMNFGTERILNPQTNEVLLGKSGKRIVTQCRQLIDPKRGGVSLKTYCPSHGRDIVLEESIRKVYDDWRNERNTSRDTQAFVTVFDLFAMHNLMTFLYTTDKDGNVNGFAALRKLGATNGYHIDPFIQTSSAPRGVSDLLIFASLAFLHAEGCSYLSLGYEPVSELDNIWGLPSILHSTTRKVYKHVFGKIPVGGKEAFHARWKPDETQEASLYLVFVGKVPSPRYMLAMMHFANVSLRRIIASDIKALRAKNSKSDSDSGTEDDADNEAAPKTKEQPAALKPETLKAPAVLVRTVTEAETKVKSRPKTPYTLIRSLTAPSKPALRQVPV